MPTKKNYQGQQQNYDPKNGEYEAGPKGAFKDFGSPSGKADAPKENSLSKYGVDLSKIKDTDELERVYEELEDKFVGTDAEWSEIDSQFDEVYEKMENDEWENWGNKKEQPKEEAKSKLYDRGRNIYKEQIRQDLRYSQNDPKKVKDVLNSYSKDIEELKQDPSYANDKETQDLVNGEEAALNEYKERYGFDEKGFDEYKEKENSKTINAEKSAENKKLKKDNAKKVSSVFDKYGDYQTFNNDHYGKLYDTELNKTAKELGVSPDVLDEKIKNAYDRYKKDASYYGTMTKMSNSILKELEKPTSDFDRVFDKMYEGEELDDREAMKKNEKANLERTNYLGHGSLEELEKAIDSKKQPKTTAPKNNKWTNNNSEETTNYLKEIYDNEGIDGVVDALYDYGYEIHSADDLEMSGKKVPAKAKGKYIYTDDSGEEFIIDDFDNLMSFDWGELE